MIGSVIRILSIQLVQYVIGMYEYSVLRYTTYLVHTSQNIEKAVLPSSISGSVSDWSWLANMQC